MKILIISQYFYPEEFKCNDIAFELSRRGYDVTVVTGIPNYPQGSFFKGYGLLKKKKEVVNSVKIRRIPLVPRGKGKGIRLALNYFSWCVLASIWILFHALKYKYDRILVHQTSPIIQGFPAIVAKKIQHIPIYFWTLDLWPESLTSAGGIHNKFILNFFTKIVCFLYRQSDKILISSKGFEKSICLKGDFADKLVYFPNWAEDIFNTQISYAIPKLPKGFKVMFAGNIGEAQDFDNIMQAARELRNEKDIKIILIGDGRKRAWVENFIKKEDLQETVYVMGRFPLQSMPIFFKQADVMLVSLKDEIIFNLTVPAKLQAYMASEKPIIAMLNGESTELIKEAKCGVTAPAGNYKKLASRILQLKHTSKEELDKMGKNGKEFCNQHFNKSKCIDHLCKLFDEYK